MKKKWIAAVLIPLFLSGISWALYFYRSGGAEGKADAVLNLRRDEAEKVIQQNDTLTRYESEGDMPFSIQKVEGTAYKGYRYITATKLDKYKKPLGRARIIRGFYITGERYYIIESKVSLQQYQWEWMTALGISIAGPLISGTWLVISYRKRKKASAGYTAQAQIRDFPPGNQPLDQ